MFATTDNPNIIEALEEMERRPRVDDEDLTHSLYHDVMSRILRMDPEDGDQAVSELSGQVTEETYLRVMDSCASRSQESDSGMRWKDGRMEEAREVYRKYADGTRPSDFEGTAYRWKYTLLARLGARSLGITSEEANERHKKGWEKKSAQEGDLAVLTILFSDLDMGTAARGSSVLSIKGSQWKSFVNEVFGLHVSSERLVRGSRFFPLLAARYRQQTALASELYLPNLANLMREFADEKGALKDGVIDQDAFPRSEWDEYAEEHELPTENHIKRAAGWNNVMVLAEKGVDHHKGGVTDKERQHAVDGVRYVTDALGIDPCEINRGKFDQEANKMGRSIRSMSVLPFSPDYTFEGVAFAASPLYAEALEKREEWGI